MLHLFFVLHFVYVTPFLCCILLVVHSFCVSFFYLFLHVALIFSCSFSVFHFFSCCTLLMLHLFSSCMLLFFFSIYFFILQHFHPELFSRCTLFMSHLFVMLGSFHVAPFFFCIYSLVALFSCCSFFMLHFFSSDLCYVLLFPWYPFLLLLFLTLRIIHIALFSHCTMSHPFHVAPFPCSTFLMLHSFHNTLFSGSLQYCTHIMLRSFGLLRLYFFILPLFHVTFFFFHVSFFMLHFTCCIFKFSKV